jgi:hypothetical protein
MNPAPTQRAHNRARRAGPRQHPQPRATRSETVVPDRLSEVSETFVGLVAGFCYGFAWKW